MLLVTSVETKDGDKDNYHEGRLGTTKHAVGTNPGNQRGLQKNLVPAWSYPRMVSSRELTADSKACIVSSDPDTHNASEKLVECSLS